MSTPNVQSMRIALLFFLTLFIVCSCQEKAINPNASLSLDDYAQMRNADFALNSHRLKATIDSMVRNDTDTVQADYYTRKYYRTGGTFVWIDRHGVTTQADTLLNFLNEVRDMGFSDRQFCVKAIDRDLHIARTLQFDSKTNRINTVMGRLEYHLTKAYLRYAVGQSFGYMNPNRIFNRMELTQNGSNTFRTLFDIDMPHAGNSFFRKALRTVANDSVGPFLRACRPDNPMYYRLLKMLHSPEGKTFGRELILVNMERCRWRVSESPAQYKKYVTVNIPAFRLWAVDGGKELTMRIGCGSVETKTPLLTSRIKRMDFNPQWIIPLSIIRKSIAQHAGNSAYFERKHYYITEKSTGLRISPSRVTRSMLESGDYHVIQEGGNHNALGRIIFRFDNDFSVYLHDTSSRGVFSQEDRGVSHGCIRVEKPMELALFMLGNSSHKEIKRIKELMTTADSIQKSKTVNPQVPLFITYYTLYPDAGGKMRRYEDVYGYDERISQYLKNYQ